MGSDEDWFARVRGLKPGEPANFVYARDFDANEVELLELPPDLLEKIHGSASEGYARAARSYLEGGHYRMAHEAFARAASLRAEGSDPGLSAGLAFSRALAAYLDLDVATFRERWCEEDEGWTLLRMDAPQCPFLSDEGTCTVYPARPVQCRTWPFWEENLASRTAWEAAKLVCPGIDKGMRVEWQEAKEIARRNEAWYEGE